MGFSKHVCCLIGPPGSGKGSNSIRFCKEFDQVKRVSIGEQLRKRKIEKGSGALADMQTVSGILDEAMKNNSLILDGFPRDFGQLKLLHSKIDKFSIIHITMDSDDKVREILSARYACLNCGVTRPKSLLAPMSGSKCPDCGFTMERRVDDSDPNAVEKRIQIYKDPLVDIYKYCLNNEIPIVEINGHKSDTYEKFRSTLLFFLAIDSSHF